ncbi:MAG: radical SAM protein [Desulfobacterales bacterium]
MKTERRTVAFSRSAVNIFFHILTGCNLKCRHCYINPDQHGRSPLSIDTIERWLSAFSPRGRNANVIFLGGEPTLHPELPEAIRTARKMGYRSVTVDTNGYLFNDILDRIAPDEVDFFSFSLDGSTAELNDRLRGQGCYEACTAGIRKAVERGFGVSAIFTVSSANLHDLPAMGPLLSALGVSRFFIQVIGLRGAPGRESEDADSPGQVAREQWLEIVPRAAESIAERGITVSFPKVYLDAGEPFECAGKVAENYFIFPNGRVYRCPLCEDFPVHGFEFREDRLVRRGPINECDLFELEIPEGCVMNRIVQPGNLVYDDQGRTVSRVACCMLKEEILPKG